MYIFLRKDEKKLKENNDLASYYFHQGTNYRAYEYLGCTVRRAFGKYLYTFRVWAPGASSVSLVSDFTDWINGTDMISNSSGVYECRIFSEKSLEKQPYKFKVTSRDGRVFYKGDPYAKFSRGGADGASLIFTSKSFSWSDSAWLKNRRKTFNKLKNPSMSVPLNIYEVHLASFIRHDDGSFYSYREIADVLVPYVKNMGYTHVEFLPLAEYPYDGSWGYQICAFYAPTSRFGDPDDFRYLIDKFHSSGIGVIMDWVPAHFPKDAWGLYEFDGTRLYEYQGRDRMESRSWGTRFFDLGREEVQSFLVSSAIYWLREFHIDGLRVDAVASMLYLDYDRDGGEWIPNANGDNINLEAVAFFKKLNSAIRSQHPDTLMIAEESGSYGGITSPIELGGLGFDLKWNMGFANDFYDYLSTDPLMRSGKHKALNFPIMYAFREKYCLPISHDEVVHGKKSFIDKMFGSYEDKFLQARAALLMMFGFPGKKLLFMGTEYAQFREWNFDDSLEWFMTDYPSHSEFRFFVSSLNELYLQRSELWDKDFSSDGFEWIYADENEKNIVAFKRYNNDGDALVFVISFSGTEQSVKIPLEDGVSLDCIFESYYGAKKNIDNGVVSLSAFGGVVLKEKSKNINIKI